MRLTVVGASGKTGRHLVEQALHAGHTVTAVVRNPTRLPIRHQRLQVVTADVLDPAAIQPAVAGADAVISALGPHPPRDRSSIMSAATASILHAMRCRRFPVIGSTPTSSTHVQVLPRL
jgi:putative NADH-flavin reductase